MRSDKYSTELALTPAVFSQRPSQPRRKEDEPRKNIDLAVSLRRHRKLFLTTLGICLLLSAIVVYLQHGTAYEAKAYAYVSPTFPTTLTEEKEQDRPYDDYMQDQIQTVTRYDIVAAAVQTLDKGVWQRPNESLQSAVNRLQHRLEVDRVGTTFQMSIALKADDPRQAAEVVNAVTNSFINKAHHEEFYGRDERLSNLRDERTRLQGDLDHKLALQAKLMQDLGVASVAAQDVNPYNNQLSKLHEDLATAREQRMQAEAQLASLNNGKGGSQAMSAAAQDLTAGDTGLSSLKGSLNQRRALLIEQMNGLTPSNPLYKQDQQELATIEKEVDQSASTLEHKAAGRIDQKLQAEVYRTRMVEGRLQEELLGQTRTATSAAPKFQQAKELGKEIERLDASYAAVDERIRNLDLESSSPGSIHLSSPALVPLTPERSRTWMLALGLLLGSCLLSCALAVGVDLFDPHLYTSADVEHVIGFPPIGVLLDHDDFSHEVSAQYLLRLAGGIHHAKNAAGARTFLFTGTMPESGTTTIVEKLGRQLRNLNLKTLTVAATNVDGKISYVTTSNSMTGDPLRTSPASSNTNGNNAGMSDKLRTSGPGTLAMNVNYTGQTTSSPVYSGTFVSQILNEVKNEYDVVLIDASPILISADTEYLARVADGTVLVVESGRATKTQLARAAQLLERLDVPGVAVALNRVSRERADISLTRDVEDFQRQLRKQRSTALAHNQARRGEVTRSSVEGDRGPAPKPEGAAATASSS